MSEIRTSTVIRGIARTSARLAGKSARLAFTTLGELLAGTARLGYKGTTMAGKGALTGIKLAGKGALASTQALQKLRPDSPPIRLSEIAPLVDSAPTARDALRQLAALPDLEIPQEQAELWKARMVDLSYRNDKLGVTQLAIDLTRERQDRLQTTLVDLADQSLRELGYTPETFQCEQGLLVGKNGIGNQTLTVEIEKCREGDVRLNLDADGFHGSACAEALDALQDNLKRRGVCFEVDTRKRKHRRPAFDGNRMRRTARNRGAGQS